MSIKYAFRLLIALVAAAAIVPRVHAQVTSTPEERRHWAEVTHQLESNPLDPAVQHDGVKVSHRIGDVNDFHVLLCSPLLTEFNSLKYTYSHAIVREFMLATAAFMIDNPDKASEFHQVSLAAVESVLKAYSAILQQKPDAKNKLLDDLLEKQKKGKLADAVRKKC